MSKKRGGTLLELMIGVTLSLLIFGATVVTLNQGFSAFRIAQEKTKSQEAARIALEESAIYIRSASAISEIKDGCGNIKTKNTGLNNALTRGNGNKIGLTNLVLPESLTQTVKEQALLTASQQLHGHVKIVAAGMANHVKLLLPPLPLLLLRQPPQMLADLLPANMFAHHLNLLLTYAPVEHIRMLPILITTGYGIVVV